MKALHQLPAPLARFFELRRARRWLLLALVGLSAAPALAQRRPGGRVVPVAPAPTTPYSGRYTARSGGIAGRYPRFFGR
ncbi:MAG: hypothetical protein WKG07_34380 [Hymenobacter sp.]